MRTTLITIVFLLGAALGYFPFAERLDQKLLDAQFRFLRAYDTHPIQNEIVIVGFNEETARVLREPMTLWHPYLRKYLEATAGAGAAAIGLDVVLPDRSYEGIVPGYDGQLLSGLLLARRKTPVVLALTADSSGKARPIYPAFISAVGKDATGYALFEPDSDGVTRHFTEMLGEDKTVPTFAGQLARRLGHGVGEGLIDFAAGEAFNFIPLQDVLEWHAAGDIAALKRAFNGKVVLLGGVFRYEDRLAAPMNLAAWDSQTTSMPGVLLHAQVLRNLLNGGLVRAVPQWLVVMACLLMALLWFSSGRLIIAVASAVCGSALVLGASTLLLAQALYLPIGSILITLFLAVMVRASFEAMLKLRERRKLRRAFGGYVSPAVMDEILAGQINPELGGEKKFVCIMFSDIRGYTSLSERMPPQDVIHFLNSYFERVVDLIHVRGGMVTCFMGDGIMAVFGAPKALDQPCSAAYSTAQELLLYVKEFNENVAANGDAPVEIGIGLHAGEAVVGHVGSSTRYDYTVIGDVTNVASRLESLTKEVGYRLVFSKAVAERLPAAFEAVPLGMNALKGHTPVEAFGYDKV